MALSNRIKNFRNGTLKLSSGGGAPQHLTVQFEAGDFSCSDLTETQTATEMVLDRGVFHDLVYTNFTPASFSFSANLTQNTHATDLTLPDLVRKAGAFAGDTSTLGAQAIWAVDCLWTVEGTDMGDASDHTLTFANCRLTVSTITEGSPSNTISIAGTVYGDITAT